jgi:hypothetical protein
MTAFTRRYYDGGGAATTLASNMGAADGSFVLTAATSWPGASPAANFAVVIDRGNSSEEKILCSGNTGTTVTVVTRGIDGTSATTHQATASVSLCGLAQDFDEANQVSNLLGNAAAGSLIIGAGAATLPTKLAVGSSASVLTGGTTPAYVSASNGQYFGVSGGSVVGITPPAVTQLTPIAKSSSYAATNGQFVNATATLTVTSPAAAAGATFGAIANYGASNASPVTLTTAAGYFIGPGIPASTSSILLGSVNANASFISDGSNWYLYAGAQDSGWITPSLTDSWTAGTPAPQYRLTGNTVRLKGEAVAPGGGVTSGQIFVLASGFRPPAIVQCGVGYIASSTPTASYLTISAAGAVTFAISGANDIGFIDSTTFTVD